MIADAGEHHRDALLRQLQEIDRFALGVFRDRQQQVGALQILHVAQVVPLVGRRPEIAVGIGQRDQVVQRHRGGVVALKQPDGGDEVLDEALEQRANVNDVGRDLRDARLAQQGGRAGTPDIGLVYAGRRSIGSEGVDPPRRQQAPELRLDGIDLVGEIFSKEHMKLVPPSAIIASANCRVSRPMPRSRLDD